MIVISWNARALNSKGKKRYLQYHLKKEKSQIVLIQETKVSGEKIEEILRRCRPKYELIAIDAKGSTRGISII